MQEDLMQAAALNERFQDIYLRPRMPPEERTKKYQALLLDLDAKNHSSRQILFTMLHHVSRDAQTPADFGLRDSFDFMMNYVRKVNADNMTEEDAERIKNYVQRRLNSNPKYMYDGFALDMPELWRDSTPAEIAAGKYDMSAP